MLEELATRIVETGVTLYFLFAMLDCFFLSFNKLVADTLQMCRTAALCGTAVDSGMLHLTMAERWKLRSLVNHLMTAAWSELLPTDRRF